MEIISRNKIMIGIVLIVVIVFMWWMLSPSAPASTDQVLTSESSTNGSDSDIVATLLQLRSVTLSGTILSDPTFLSLQDFGVDITPEPVGRPNPFAPFQVSAPPSNSKTTQQAQIFAPKQ